MIEVIPFEALGLFDTDWLSARHHFSFGTYHDPARMGLGTLRVWNDDTVAPGRGFDQHGHRDMEIITYVRRGAISHQDHLGNRGRTEAGDVQVMSAGTGIRHAEYNLELEPTQIFQIWVLPDRRGVEPRWESRSFPKAGAAGELVALASGRPEDAGALRIHQDAAILGATLQAGQRVIHKLGPGRAAYLVPAQGRVEVAGIGAKARDGVAIRDESEIIIVATEDAEIVLTDVNISN